MKYRFWTFAGRICFYATYPLLAMYLSKDPRTRIMIVHDKEVLLVRSWLSNGSWDLPGGGLHKKEDPLTGVTREATEELGLKLTASKVKRITKKQFRSGMIRYETYYFVSVLPAKPSALRLQKLEISEARWIKQSEIKNLRLHPQLKEMVATALAGNDHVV